MKSLTKILILFFCFILFPGIIVSQVSPPQLNKVSVMNNNADVLITWQQSPSMGVVGYIIYEFIGDFQGINTIQIDVVNESQTSYTALATQAHSRSIAYVIAAFVMDGTDTIRSALTLPQRTIFLEPDWDPCNTSTVLVWNSYTGWSINLTGYQASWYIQGEPTITTEAFVNAPDTVFIHNNPPPNTHICYFIKAFNSQGYESVSNTHCLTTSVQVPPAYIHADFATITAENKVELQFHPDPLAQTDLYELYRSSSITGPFEFLAVLNQFPPSVIIYTDNLANPEKVHFYKLVGLNQCEIPVVESNPASNISLTVTQNNGVNILSWNAYKIWFGGVQKYEVYRFSENDQPILIGSVQEAFTGFQDEPGIGMQSGQSGEFCYFIKGIEGDANPYGFQSVSLSNIACAISEPEIFLPNAFTPDGDGINDYFTPFFTFLPASYQIVIYDRWRNVIFESRNVNIHWDGTTRGGRKAPEGIYTFILLIETQSGRKIQKTGQIALVYP